MWIDYKYCTFSHLLRRLNFSAVVDHLALTYIMGTTSELATNMIQRLLEVMSLYMFHPHYLKSKDMILSDLLSMIEANKIDHHEVIPISFNSPSILKEHIIPFNMPWETYSVVTRSQTKAIGTQMQKIHETDKVVNLALKPELQARKKGTPKPIPVVPKSVVQLQSKMPPVLSRKGQGIAGARRKITGPRLQHYKCCVSLLFHLRYLQYQNLQLKYSQLHTTLRCTPSNTILIYVACMQGSYSSTPI